MNEKMRKLLDQINAKKAEVQKLAEEEKLEEAKKAKDELVKMQEKFDLLSDLEEDKQTGTKGQVLDQVHKGTAKTPGGNPVQKDKASVVKSFVNIIKAGFFHEQPADEDIAVYQDALTSSTTPNETGEKGIGITIPEDIRTDIIELRRSDDNLEQYVNVEGVTTSSGTRNIEVDAESVPFDNVEEGAEFPEMNEPTFRQIKYNIKKMGGILKITAELLEDTAANIMAYVNRWIAKKTKATRNMMILKKLNEMTAGKEVAITDVDSLKDIFNVTLDPAIASTSIVITNQDGFNYLDKLKDSDKKYILQQDPTQRTKGKMLFGEYRIIIMSKKVLKSTEVKGDGGKVTAYKYPVFCGDLKEAVTLFDRNVMSIDMNDKAAGLWEKDMTGIKVRDRFDVESVDDDAVIKGEITVAAK